MISLPRIEQGLLELPRQSMSAGAVGEEAPRMGVAERAARSALPRRAPGPRVDGAAAADRLHRQDGPHRKDGLAEGDGPAERDGPLGSVVAARSIFQQEWWLEASSGGRIERVEVRWDGRVVGSLSFVRRRRFGLRSLVMPPYTRTLGPVFSLPPSGPFKRGQNIRRVTEALVRALPAHDRFHQTLEPGDESPMAFDLAGFRIAQCFTFVVPPVRAPEQVWRRCDQKTRNMLTSAGARHQVVDSGDLAEFIALSRAEHPDPTNIHDFGRLRAIYEACVAHDAARLLVARDAGGGITAAAILIRDARTVYFWVSARSRAASSGGANALLLWRGMQWAHGLGLAFDCDGYSSAGAAKFLASFGEPPVARTEILHTTLRWDSASYARDVLRRIGGEGDVRRG